MWWRISCKRYWSIYIFKEKIAKGIFLENDISLYERSQSGNEIYVWVCKPLKKDKFAGYKSVEKPIYILFGIGEGRVYVKEGRLNTENEGKKKF